MQAQEISCSLTANPLALSSTQHESKEHQQQNDFARHLSSFKEGTVIGKITISYSKLFLELFVVRLKNQWVLAEQHFPIIGAVDNSDSRRAILALVHYTHTVLVCPGTL